LAGSTRRREVTCGTVTLPEFAERYGISRSAAYDLASRGELPVPVIALGKRRVLSRELVERLLSGEELQGSQAIREANRAGD
jgi:predicted DNA-binding transcriptional regulator AlpA